jgi:IS5 family transposase
VVGVRGFAGADSRFDPRRARLSAACDVQDPVCSAVAHTERRGGSGPAVIPPLAHGLLLEADTPDHASIWRFRQAIDKLGPSTALLSETNRQLDALGLIVKRGTLGDATLIEAAVKRPPYGGGGINPRDPDAWVTIKRRQAYFGYKAHLWVDAGAGLVRQAEMTSANVHDSRLAEALIQGDEQGYFADMVYSCQAFREALERHGLIDGVAWRGRPLHPLGDWQRLLNSWPSSIRCGVERAHATMK